MSTDGWTLEWPTVDGIYIFYGNYAGEPPKFQMCRVMQNKSGSGKVVGRTADGHFLYKEEQTGAFKPFDEEPPDLVAMRRPTRIPTETK